MPTIRSSPREIRLNLARRYVHCGPACALAALLIATTPRASLALTQSDWAGFGGDAQHTADSSVASTPLQAILWHTSVDLAPPNSGSGDLDIHYGSPIVTADDTVVVPVKTTSVGGFNLQAFNGATGQKLWSTTSNYVLPAHDWVPSYSPTLATNDRVYFAGAGGTIYYRDNADSASTGPVHQIAFYGNNNYIAHQSAFNNSLFIDTPITADAAGDIYFGFRASGTNPLSLTSGIARITPDGTATYTSVSAASNHDGSVTTPVINCAPALSNDGKTLYITLGNGSPFFGGGDLVALNSTTLQSQAVVHLSDPASHGIAYLPDNGSAAPMVGPDGDVYIGVLDNSLGSNHGRGWMLHFSANLSQQKTPGAFGWDDTSSVVPASMVPSYGGTSPYLIMTKYNNYDDFGGNGLNKLAILDPNATQVDPATGTLTMRKIEMIVGPTPDPTFSAPDAVKEWCINSAAVDPATDSILVNSEDGVLYRWNLASDALTESVRLTAGVGEAYTPTVITADGSTLAIQDSTLFDVGAAPASAAIRAVPLPAAIWSAAALLGALGLIRLRRFAQ